MNLNLAGGPWIGLLEGVFPIVSKETDSYPSQHANTMASHAQGPTARLLPLSPRDPHKEDPSQA